ncbi:hypothetical protein [Sphingobacterium ginsenosidimutans]|uniref:Serine endopeptidase n=1 Tax=Sphingobacterium ginsenosidimutans TaxID=687845 RepID=A0ABP7ZSD1_9SPHI
MLNILSNNYNLKYLKKSMDKKKQVYVSPLLIRTEIEMESGIAAGSATLRPGDSGNPDSPKVNDWSSGGDVGSGDNDFDF